MADGDYERGRNREIGAIAAELKRLAATRPPVFVLNGWAASPHAWDLCRFRRTRLFGYVEQLDGEPEKAIEKAGRCILVGWSMGGSSALRLAARWPEKIAGLVLLAATPRMMEEKGTGWRGMSPRRLEALRYGLVMTRGAGFFGVPEGKPNPYLADAPANLERGLKYLLETDLRRALTFNLQPSAFNRPVHIFQSEHDGIVRPENAAWLKDIFPQASVTMVPGTEHALPIFIPEKIDDAVDACLAVAQKG
jgi:pimeloyl-[acyl-carrier protein] methyl ester esterase